MDVPLGSASRRWPPSSQMCLRSTGGMMVLAVEGTTVSTRLFDFAFSRGSIKGLTVVEYSDQTDIFVEDCDPQQRREVWLTPSCLCNHRDHGFKTCTIRMMCAWWAWMVHLNPPPLPPCSQPLIAVSPCAGSLGWCGRWFPLGAGTQDSWAQRAYQAKKKS